jgi:dTDP-4-dehydrorhamnose 3,5-epimerase
MFWTTSARGTVRGMHFQTPPFEVAKLVWVSSGRILDVAVDMRPGATFGELHVFEMSSSSQTLFIPAGFAHGFQSLEDDSRVNYAVDREYAPANDDGVRWDSVGVTWPLPAGPLSERDRGFVALEDFQSPFEAP